MAARPTLADMYSDSHRHNAWMDAFFASYYAHQPVNATFIGEGGHDHRLPDLSESGVGDALADIADLLRTVQEEDATLSGTEALDSRLARGFLRIQDWEFRSLHFNRGNPSLCTGEAVFGVMSLFLNHAGPLTERLESATQRMEGVPAFLAQCRANIGRAPRAWTERAIRECDGALLFFTEGVEALAAERGFDAASFHAAARAAARGFSEHRAHLESELLSHTSEEYAAGGEALDLYLREGHFLAQSAEEMVRYAEDQMAEAQAYLGEHASDFEASSPTQALAGLAHLHPLPGAYHARYQELWNEVRGVADEKDLLTWPDFPIRYVPRPAWSRKAAPFLYFLFYRSPAAFNRPDVHDYLVMPLDPDGGPEETATFLRANNDSVIKLNHVVHHGGLGHHVQNWHAFRAESRIGRIAAVDCASRIALFCGGTMAEGWACYATDLAGEAGALTPLERYAEVHSRVRMAARTIVDVRLHRGEMTLDEAAVYYETNAGMNGAAARGEAVKNSMFPGAAVMYLMGTDAIHTLRQEIMAQMGPEFELRRFHDEFLSYGSVPVALVAEDMKRRAGDAE